MLLGDVCEVLASFLSPDDRYALPGLVLGPLDQNRTQVYVILLADHVTELVLHEAVALRAQLVISRISPLSGEGDAGVARVDRLVSARADSAAHVAMMCAKEDKGVFVFGAGLDHAEGGVEQWLCAILGAGREEPIVPHPPPRSASGRGRLLTLSSPAYLRSCIQALRSRGAARAVTVAPASKHYGEVHSTGIDAAVKRAMDETPVSQIAVCFGSDCDEVLRTCARAQVFIASDLTTESVLAANDRNVTVVLIGDSVGREFYGFLVDRLQGYLGSTQLFVSKAAQNPLRHEGVHQYL